MSEKHDDMILPGTVIASLYRQVLVVPEMDWEKGDFPAPSASTATRTENGSKQSDVSEVVSEMASLGATKSNGSKPSGVAAETCPQGASSETSTAPTTVSTGAASKSEAASSAYRFLGNNSKKVVIIVNFPNDAFLPEHHLQFLGKILGACKMNLGDIAIVNHAAQPVVIHILKQQLQPAHILLFGPAPTDIQLPMSFPPFKQQQYDSCQYLYATPLDQLNREGDEGKQLKGQLWACLKQMFNV